LLFRSNQDNIWVGYFSSYFGAIFGGIIGGLFTFLGMKLTIRDQRVTNDEKLKRENRPFLQLGEIYNVGLNLSNLQETNGYIIITDYYRAAIDNNITDGNYNFIEINNLGPGVAINCEVNITIMFEDNQETISIEIQIPTINSNDKYFILVDLIPLTRQYRITQCDLTYQTVYQEEFRIRRFLNDSNRVVFLYDVKNGNGDYIEHFSINGSSSEWI